MGIPSDLMEQAKAYGVPLVRPVYRDVVQAGDRVPWFEFCALAEEFCEEHGVELAEVTVCLSDYDSYPEITLEAKAQVTDTVELRKQIAWYKRCQQNLEEAERRQFEVLKQKYGREEGV